MSATVFLLGVVLVLSVLHLLAGGVYVGWAGSERTRRGPECRREAAAELRQSLEAKQG